MSSQPMHRKGFIALVSATMAGLLLGHSSLLASTPPDRDPEPPRPEPDLPTSTATDFPRLVADTRAIARDS